MGLAHAIIIGVGCASLGVAQANESSSFESPFGLKLEQATLSDIRARFGEADEFEIPESHHQFGICYMSKDSEEIVIFKSGREFGGPKKKLLLGVDIHARNNRSFPCATSNLESSELKIGDLALGVTPEVFQSLLDTEAESTNQSELFFNLEHRRRLTPQEVERFERIFPDGGGPDGMDVGLGIWCKMNGGHATEVGVWQISTY